MSIATPTERLQQVLSEALMNEWEAQGHSMGGGVVKSIEYVVKQEINKLTLQGFMYPYGNIQAAGIKKDRIPFSPRGMGFRATGAGTSLYIQAIQEWVKNRMNISDSKKSLSIAFAIATTQKKYGMPTPASVFYSKTGKRTEWIEEAFKRDESKIREAISNMAFNMLTVNLDVILNKWQIELNKTE